MATRGIRNDNPLNIRHGKSQWVGMREKQTDKAFVQFKSRVYGYRAAFVLLRNYIRKGVNTIGKIIARWAPSSDGNNTRAYIDFVSRTSGIDASRTITFEDKDDLVEIVRSMAQVESGIIESKEIIEQAYEMAH
ncbi:MAG: structural protein P5 [Prevotellaceae bacterium]|nr:structural protein P5 [Candidatus Minthosoma equi]